MFAIRIHQPGGRDQLTYEQIDTPEPGRGEARIRVAAAGVNFIDTYQRSGAYKVALPFIPGSEAAGVVDAVGDGVSEVAVGDEVAFAMSSGAYAEYVNVPAWKLVRVAEGVSLNQAAAIMLQGMTAHYLTQSTYPLQAGETALVHAAAGGVGLLLCQMARRLGARVIGTASTAEKAELARRYGADEVILYEQDDFVQATRALTDGRGVDVVYDGVGRSTFMRGLDCLRPRGMMVLYGQAGGAVPPFDLQTLNAKGSLFVTRPSLGHYAANRGEVNARAADLFAWLAAGELEVRIDRTFELAEAAAAHEYIEGRQTQGKLLLIPPQAQVTPEETIDTSSAVDQSLWESFPASDPPAY